MEVAKWLRAPQVLLPPLVYFVYPQRCANWLAACAKLNTNSENDSRVVSYPHTLLPFYFAFFSFLVSQKATDTKASIVSDFIRRPIAGRRDGLVVFLVFLPRFLHICTLLFRHFALGRRRHGRRWIAWDVTVKAQCSTCVFYAQRQYSTCPRIVYRCR